MLDWSTAAVTVPLEILDSPYRLLLEPLLDYVKGVADRRQPDGTGWVVLADPEGNEFCVERSAAERTAGPAATG